MNEKTRMQQFDATEAFNAEAQPLYQRLHEIAKRHGVAAVFAACTACEGNDGYTSVGMIHLNGVERTPDAFAIGSAFLHNGIEEGMRTAQGFMLKRLMAGLGAEENTAVEEGVKAAPQEDAKPAGASLH